MDPVSFLRAQWDRVLALLAIGLGLLVLYLGYQGVSETAFVAAQLPYFVSGGLLGVFLLCVGATAWLSADLRDDWRELRQIRELLERNESSRSGIDARTSAPASVVGPEALVESSAVSGDPPEERTMVVAGANEAVGRVQRSRQPRAAGGDAS